MAVQQVTVNSADGATIGADSTELVSFHGATPCDQAAAATSVSAASTVSVCGQWGFASSAVATGLVTNVNAIIALLKEKGLMASS
jgi:hypothetical protein